MTTDPTTPSVDETRARRDAGRTAESDRLTAELRDSRAGLVEHDRDAAERVGGMFPADPTTTEPSDDAPATWENTPCRYCWGIHPNGTACPGPADSGMDMGASR